MAGQIMKSSPILSLQRAVRLSIQAIHLREFTRRFLGRPFTLKQEML